MRQNAPTIRTVLKLDHRGAQRAAREVSEGWDTEDMRRRQEAWAQEVWTPGGWLVAWREGQAMLFSREDF